MKTLVAAAALIAAVLAGPAAEAQEVVLPGKIAKRDLPATSPDGQRMTGLALPATVAIRLPSREIVVFYGYIVGKSPKAPSWTWTYNDALDMTCWTRMIPRADGSAQGQTTCSAGGAQLSDMPLDVPAGKYGKLKGTLSATTRATDGQRYTYVFRWATGRHPDPAPLVKALQK